MIRRTPRSTRTDTLFPYTTLFRSSRSAPIDRLGGEIGLEPLGAQLAAEATRLDSAERRIDVQLVVVDAHGSALDPSGQGQSVLLVRAPDHPAETEVGVVGNRDRQSAL